MLIPPDFPYLPVAPVKTQRPPRLTVSTWQALKFSTDYEGLPLPSAVQAVEGHDMARVSPALYPSFIQVIMRFGLIVYHIETTLEINFVILSAAQDLGCTRTL
jgi:hypothetical protein